MTRFVGEQKLRKVVNKPLTNFSDPTGIGGYLPRHELKGCFTRKVNLVSIL